MENGTKTDGKKINFDDLDDAQKEILEKKRKANRVRSLLKENDPTATQNDFENLFTYCMQIMEMLEE